MATDDKKASTPAPAGAKTPLSLDQFKIDPKKASEAELKEAMELLAKQRLRKEKIKAGEIKGYAGKKVSEMTPEQQATYRARLKRQLARQSLYIKKAKAAGITVTDAEIDKYIAANSTAAK